MSSGVSSSNNLGLTFDQSQLIQISHLMGGEQQQHAQSFSSNSEPPVLASFQVNQPATVNFGDQQPQQFFVAADHAASGGGGDQFTSQGGSADQSNQVHTIMVNGQPALFIPASAAMSSSLLCQMMMNNNQTAAVASNSQQYEYIQIPSDNSTHSQQQFISVDQLFNGAAYLTGDLGGQQQSIVLNAQPNSAQMAFIQKSGGTDQQLVCGELVSSTFQPFVSSQPQESPKTPEVRTPSKCAPILPAPEGGRKIPMVKTTPKKHKGPTVASVLASSANNSPSHHHNLSYLSSASPGGGGGIIYASPVKLASKSKETSEADDQAIQFIFLNTTNMSTAAASKPDEPVAKISISSAACELDQQKSQATEAEAETASSPDKKRRKACDCPNCVRWRTNLMTDEELKKRRTHKCHKCAKEYNKTSHLRAHLRAHDGHRPFVCEVKACGKSFTRSDELRRHSRIHNDDRNYSCSICNKKFLRSDHLNKHVLVHSNSNSNNSKPPGAVLSEQPASPLSESDSESEFMTERSPGQLAASSSKHPVKA